MMPCPDAFVKYSRFGAAQAEHIAGEGRHVEPPIGCDQSVESRGKVEAVGGEFVPIVRRDGEKQRSTLTLEGGRLLGEFLLCLRIEQCLDGGAMAVKP